MLESAPGSQLHEWQSYSRIEPFGEDRADLRAGIVAATTANCHRSSRTKAFTPEDFMPKWGGSNVDEKQSAKEIVNSLKMFAMAHNKRLEARRDG